MRYTGVLLVSDMDGTLLDSRRALSEENQAAIHSFIEQGGRFTVATGRMPQSAALYLKKIFPNCPGICCNGGVIYDFSHQQVLRSFSFDPGTRRCLLPVLAALREALPQVSINLDTTEGSAYWGRNRMTEAICRMLQRTDVPYLTSTEEVSGALLRVALGFDKTQEKDLEAFLAAQAFPQEVRLLRTDEIFYELIPRSVNKGRALTQWFRSGSEVDTVVSVGDNENDIEMLRWADRSFAPANAAPVAKAAAGEVLSVTNDEHVLAQVIARL